jgi:DNA-binding LytR/AlgR family response regulator
MRVLIIEDDQAISSAILRIIKLDFHEEVTASQAVSTVYEGIAALPKFLPDIILFDVHLPDGTGFNILHRLPSDHSAIKVCISGQPMDSSTINELAREGVYSFIAKPFSVKQLQESLRAAMMEIRQKQQREFLITAVFDSHDALHAKVLEQEQELLTLKQAESVATINDEERTATEESEETEGAQSAIQYTAQDITMLLLTFRTDGEDKCVRLPTDDILYIEARGNKVLIHQRNEEKLEVKRTLKALEEQLVGQDFLRCHASYLVNCRAITAYSASSLMLGEVRIGVSRKYQSAVRLRLRAWRGQTNSWSNVNYSENPSITQKVR